MVAEGPETGLSLAQTLPNTSVKVTLGKSNLINIDGQSLNPTVIVCLDNDNKLAKKDPMLIAAVAKLVEQGKDVRIMIPHGLGDIKQDYNDVLRHKGETAIRQDFDKAVSCERFFDQSFGKTTSHPSLQNKRENYLSSLQTSKCSDKDDVKVVQPRQVDVEIER